LENRRSKDDKVSRRVSKAVETEVGKVRMAENKKRKRKRRKKGRNKKKKNTKEEKKKKEGRRG